MAEENEQQWCIKIGCTRDWRTLDLRRMNLQTGNPRYLHVIQVFARPGVEVPHGLGFSILRHADSGYELEQQLLRQWDDKLIPGTEWVIGVSPMEFVDRLYGYREYHVEEPKV